MGIFVSRLHPLKTLCFFEGICVRQRWVRTFLHVAKVVRLPALTCATCTSWRPLYGDTFTIQKMWKCVISLCIFFRFRTLFPMLILHFRTLFPMLILHFRTLFPMLILRPPAPYFSSTRFLWFCLFSILYFLYLECFLIVRKKKHKKLIIYTAPHEFQAFEYPKTWCRASALANEQNDINWTT